MKTAMSKRVLIRFVPPAPVKITVSKGVSRTRDWNTDKLVDFLQEGLEIWAADAYPELELNVVDSRQAGNLTKSWPPKCARLLASRWDWCLKASNPTTT